MSGCSRPNSLPTKSIACTRRRGNEIFAIEDGKHGTCDTPKSEKKKKKKTHKTHTHTQHTHKTHTHTHTKKTHTHTQNTLHTHTHKKTHTHTKTQHTHTHTHGRPRPAPARPGRPAAPAAQTPPFVDHTIRATRLTASNPWRAALCAVYAANGSDESPRHALPREEGYHGAFRPYPLPPTPSPRPRKRPVTPSPDPSSCL